MKAVIQYCNDCPLRQAKEKELKGNDQFFFTPPAMLDKCYQCHLKQAEERIETTKRIERLNIDPKKT